MSTEDIDYKRALEATENYDGSIGFSGTANLNGAELARRTLQQNNTIIQLLIDLHRKVGSLQAELTTLKNQGSTSKGTDIPNLDEVISKLDNLSIEGKGKRVEKQKGVFYAYKDPRIILEEVKAKEKR